MEFNASALVASNLVAAKAEALDSIISELKAKRIFQFDFSLNK